MNYLVPRSLQMWKVYFGEWGEGRLKRLPYLGYYLLLMVLMFGIVLGLLMAMGLGGELMGNMMAAEALFVEKFGILMVIGIFALMFGMMLAHINIMAKRIRDMGLPPLWTILGIIAVSMVLNVLFPAQQMEMSTAVVATAEGTHAAVNANANEGSVIVQLFDLIIFLSLVLIPSNTFGNKENPSE